MKKLYVYLIGEIESDAIKIGYGQNPDKRVIELQIGNPRELRLFHSFETNCAESVEAFVQRKFSKNNIRGEWYNADINKIIDSINEGIILANNGKLPNFSKNAYLRYIDGKLERMCTMCRIWKLVDNFYKANNKRMGYQGRCKSCDRKYQREYGKIPYVKEKHNKKERKRKRLNRIFKIHANCHAESTRRFLGIAA